VQGIGVAENIAVGCVKRHIQIRIAKVLIGDGTERFARLDCVGAGLGERFKGKLSQGTALGAALKRIYAGL
jgi:hypothetical protein